MSIASGYINNFDTLCHAMERGEVGLLECKDAKTGQTVIALCAVQTDSDRSVSMIPLAKLFDGNPYEELIPPEVPPC
jgi:Family of unknown function (DUF6117)